MTDVFEELKKRYNVHAGKRQPDQLTQGKAYPVFEFAQRKSDFIDRNKEYPMLLIAYFKDPDMGNNKYYVSLPTLYNNLDELHVAQLNQDIKDGKVPFIVFYGKDGRRNDLILHKFGEEIDCVKLNGYLKQETEESPVKKLKMGNKDEASSSKV